MAKTPQTRAGRRVTHRIVENTERAKNDQSHQSNPIKSNPIQKTPQTRARRGVTHRIVENAERATPIIKQTPQMFENHLCFPRFCAPPPSPLGFGTFLKRAQNSSHELLFDGLSKNDVSLERGCKKCKNANGLEREASFSKKTTQTRRAEGGPHRIVEITERAKTEGR